jgi:hypothetical protein
VEIIAVSDPVFASDQRPRDADIESMSARVLADAQRSFAARCDTTVLKEHVNDIVRGLWSESTRVPTFISVLALRDLRDRLGDEAGPSHG